MKTLTFYAVLEPNAPIGLIGKEYISYVNSWREIDVPDEGDYPVVLVLAPDMDKMVSRLLYLKEYIVGNAVYSTLEKLHEEWETVS